MYILIVEDEPEIQFILYKSLEKAGHNCWVANNGCEAIQVCKIIKFDVIISDWRMPIMNGLDLCKSIRDLDEKNNTFTYFMFLTAMADRQYCLQGLRAGANDYLLKPLDRYALKLKLKNAALLLGYNNELSAENEFLTQELRLDPLTRLGNRRKLQEDVRIMNEMAKRYKASYAMVMLDIDDFKSINDKYGHAAGDQVIIGVAQTLQEQMRTTDWVYRYGGEEFLLILPEQNSKNIVPAIERILELVASLKIHHTEDEDPIEITMSAGIAFLNDVMADPDIVFTRADECLYEAKLRGKNCIVVHKDEETNPTIKVSHLEQED